MAKATKKSSARAKAGASRKLDHRHLTFLFQERLKNGTQSNFFRLDNPDREEG